MTDEQAEKYMKDERRIAELAHAMQTGVAMMLQYGPGDSTPKHLRVGVNMAMVEHGALVNLLMDKGIITRDEINAALIQALEKEVKTYEEEIGDFLGRKVTLG